MNGSNVLLYVLVILMLFSCGVPEEESFIQNNKMEVLGDVPIRWHKNNLPVSLAISDEATDRCNESINNATNEWESAAQMDLFGTPYKVKNLSFSKIEDYYYKDKDHNGIYFAHNKVEGIPDDVLATCQVFIQSSINEFGQKYYEVKHGDIIFNTSVFDFNDMKPGDSGGSYDFATTVMHELGHLLGIQHTNSGAMSGSGQKVSDCDPQVTSEDLEALYKNYDPVPSSVDEKIVRSLNARYKDKCECLVQINRKVAGELEFKIIDKNL